MTQKHLQVPVMGRKATWHEYLGQLAAGNTLPKAQIGDVVDNPKLFLVGTAVDQRPKHLIADNFLISKPVITAPEAISFDGSATLTVAGSHSLYPDEAVEYRFFQIGDEAESVGGSYALSWSGSEAHAETVYCYAIGSKENISDLVQVTIPVIPNEPPNVDNASASGIPANMLKNNSFTFSVSGATDPEGNGAVVYSVEFLNPDGSDNADLSTPTPDGNADGADITVNSGDVSVDTAVTVKVVAVDTAGGRTLVVAEAVTVLKNSPPDASNITHDLPGTIARGTTYTVNLSGAVDPDGDNVTYELQNLVGCNSTLMAGITGSVEVAISPTASAVSFDILARDSNNALSLNELNVSRGDTHIVQPSGSSGALPAGTHSVVVPAGVDSITVEIKGGSGSTTTSKTCPPGYVIPPLTSQNGMPGVMWCCYATNPANQRDQTPCQFMGGEWQLNYCYKCNTDTSLTNLVLAENVTNQTTGGSTSIKDGGVTLETAAGGVGGAASAITRIVSIDNASETTLTVVVSNGGSAQLDW